MDPHSYYEKIILGYLVSDTKYLLEANEPRNGLLLAPVVNGIDAIGGALHGFDARNGDRSRKVMTGHMEIHVDLAKFIYSSLRCGLAHEGTANYGICFFAEYGNLNRDSVAYEGEDEWIYLDSVLLAQRFVLAAEKIWETQKKAILHTPRQCESGHADVVKLHLPRIDDFFHELTEHRECKPPHVEEFAEGRWRRNFASRSNWPPVTELKNTLKLPPIT